VAIDGWLRVVGTEGVYSLGDCSFMVDTPLPATAQVASQQGSYLGRLFSKGFSMRGSEGPPIKMAPGVSAENVESMESSSSTSAGAGVDTSEPVEQQILRAAKQRISPSPSYASASTPTSSSTSAAVRFASDQANIGKLGVVRPYTSDTGTGPVVIEYAKPFQFLNLGVLAYIGASEALAQISVDQKTIRGTGSVGFLLWRGIYWFKQVSWRNRVLVSVDWAKGRLFGRDIGSL
jgi:NADH:ubiquinone reductase (non-electrogenic)